MTLREALEKREGELLGVLDEAKRLGIHSPALQSTVAAYLAGIRYALNLARKEERNGETEVALGE